MPVTFGQFPVTSLNAKAKLYLRYRREVLDHSIPPKRPNCYHTNPFALNTKGPKYELINIFYKERK